MANVTITELPQAGAITGTEAVPIVQNGQTVQTTASALAGSPIQTQTFLTLNQEPTLANSRSLSAGTGVGLVDGGAQSTLQITLNAASGSLEAASNGLIAKTASNAVTARSITVSGSGLSVTNGDGVSGNPDLALTGLPSSLAGLSGSGFLCLPNNGTVSSATLTGTGGQITVTGGDGTSGNPTFAIATDPALPGNAGAVMPAGSTAQRSGSPVNGTLRYNSDIGLMEGYLNSSWQTLTAGSAGVISIATGTGLTGGPITSTGTISIANTGVSAGSYIAADITVNAQGQITAAASNTSLVTSFSAGSTGLTPSTATTGAVTLAGTLNVANGGTGAATLTGYVYGNGTSAMTASTTIPTTDLSGTVTNAQLANSSLTVGTTNIALGATSLTLGGLSSVAVTADPTTAFQLTTKQYVDGLVATGLYYHDPVQAATTGTLASITGGTVTYNNGTAGVGATLTLSLPLLILDGYTLLNTNRVLVKDEANQAYNGVYTYATGGTVLTRSTDTDTYGTGTGDLSQNDYFFVQNGTTNAGTSWVCTTVGTITFGTTAITFAQFSTSQVYTGTSPIQVSGTVISLNTVPVASGGTNLTSYTAGDLLYASGTTTIAKLGIGTTNYVLTSSGSAPQYVDQSTLTAGAATNIAGGAAGSVPYNTGSGATSFLALGTTNYVLTAGASAPQYVAQSTLSVGSATTATTATNATNVAITANSTNATNYLTFVSATTGNLGQLVNSSITCNPSTGAITGGISGGTF